MEKLVFDYTYCSEPEAWNWDIPFEYHKDSVKSYKQLKICIYYIFYFKINLIFVMHNQKLKMKIINKNI